MAKIAVIEDSQSTIDMIKQILKDEHDVTGFTDVSEIEAQLSELKPDLVLLDIVMPERDGYQILRSIKRDNTLKEIPVIVVSNKSEDTDVAWAKRQGASDYVIKPFNAEGLIKVVEKHLP